MAKRKESDRIVAYIENVSDRHIIIDNPESSQGRRREGTLPDSIMMEPGCKSGMNARQLAEWGDKRGVKVKLVDDADSRHLKRMG